MQSGVTVRRISDNQQVTQFISNTTTIPFTPSSVDIYQVWVSDASNNLQKAVTFTVTQVGCINGVPFQVTPIPPSQSEKSTVNIVDGWVGLMGLGVNAITKFLFAWFWITIFGAIGLARSEGKPLMGTIFALFPFGFFVFIAYLPAWFIIIVVLEVLVATRVFK